MASGGVRDNVVYGALMFFSDSKKNKSKKKSNFVSKPVKFYQTAQLHETFDVQQEDHILHMQTSDKLTIFLRCNNVFIVHRHRDGAVAVLKNARFQQSNPPVTLDGSKYSVFMEGAGMTLMYAVALENCKEGSGIKVYTNDVVLILAVTKGYHFVAITPCLKVVLLPTAMLRVLTYPRRLLREGMTLKMKSMDGKLIQELFKATEDLFTWRTKYGEMVPLHSFEREVDFDVSNVLRDAPPLPPPRLPPTETSQVQICYEGTTAIHQRILDFAKSAGLSFQDDEPIRLGGASVKSVNPYATYSDIIARNDDKLFKPRQGARKGDTEDTYEELYEPNLTATPLLTTSNSLNYGGYEVVVAPENCKCTEERKQADSLYNYIKETFDASTLEALRFLREHGHKCVSDDIHSDVADHLVEAKWDEFGKLLKVPANIRHRIQKSSEDICERTVALLKAWHQRLGNGATLGILVDALVKVELNEISMLLEDLCETVRLCDSPHD